MEAGTTGYLGQVSVIGKQTGVERNSVCREENSPNYPYLRSKQKRGWIWQCFLVLLLLASVLSFFSSYRMTETKNLWNKEMPTNRLASSKTNTTVKNSTIEERKYLPSSTPPTTTRLPICRGDSYHVGKWEKQESHTFHSCPWNQHRNCMQEEAQKPFGKDRIIKAMQWEWTPATCQLHPFHHTQLSKALKEQDRQIVYIGDSLNTDMANSMRCMMAQTKTDWESTSSFITNIRDDLLGCPPKSDAAYGTPQYCSNRTEVVQIWRGWVQNFGIHDRDVLVINTGAHWHGTPEATAGAFLNIANAISEVFRGKVVVRTTVMGHEGCENYGDAMDPVANAQITTDSVAAAASNSDHMPYNWNNFGTLNDLIAKAMEESDLMNYEILYVDMFEQRPDGHYQGAPGGSGIDCLHYCVPGPIHWWNKLLYHIIYDTIFSTSMSAKEKHDEKNTTISFLTNGTGTRDVKSK